jgi:uncharacterized Zn-finger protein
MYGHVNQSPHLNILHTKARNKTKRNQTGLQVLSPRDQKMTCTTPPNPTTLQHPRIFRESHSSADEARKSPARPITQAVREIYHLCPLLLQTRIHLPPPPPPSPSPQSKIKKKIQNASLEHPNLPLPHQDPPRPLNLPSIRVLRERKGNAEGM